VKNKTPTVSREKGERGPGRAGENSEKANERALFQHQANKKRNTVSAQLAEVPGGNLFQRNGSQVNKIQAKKKKREAATQRGGGRGGHPERRGGRELPVHLSGKVGRKMRNTGVHEGKTASKHERPGKEINK